MKYSETLEIETNRIISIELFELKQYFDVLSSSIRLKTNSQKSSKCNKMECDSIEPHSKKHRNMEKVQIPRTHFQFDSVRGNSRVSLQEKKGKLMMKKYGKLVFNQFDFKFQILSKVSNLNDICSLVEHRTRHFNIRPQSQKHLKDL